MKNFRLFAVSFLGFLSTTNAQNVLFRETFRDSTKWKTEIYEDTRADGAFGYANFPSNKLKLSAFQSGQGCARAKAMYATKLNSASPGKNVQIDLYTNWVVGGSGEYNFSFKYRDKEVNSILNSLYIKTNVCVRYVFSDTVSVKIIDPKNISTTFPQYNSIINRPVLKKVSSCVFSDSLHMKLTVGACAPDFYTSSVANLDSIVVTEFDPMPLKLHDVNASKPTIFRDAGNISLKFCNINHRTITICDIMGRFIFNGQSDGEIFSLNFLSKGSYIVTVFNQNEKETMKVLISN